MLAFKHKTCYNTAKPDGGRVYFQQPRHAAIIHSIGGVV